MDQYEHWIYNMDRYKQETHTLICNCNDSYVMTVVILIVVVVVVCFYDLKCRLSSQLKAASCASCHSYCNHYLKVVIIP